MSIIVKYQCIVLNNEVVSINLHYEKFPLQKTIIGILGLSAIGCIILAGLTLMRHPLGSFLTNHSAYVILGSGVGAGIVSVALTINIVKRALYLKRRIDESWEDGTLEERIKRAIEQSKIRSDWKDSCIYTLTENDLEFKAVLGRGKKAYTHRGDIHFFIKDSFSIHRFFTPFTNIIPQKKD